MNIGDKIPEVLGVDQDGQLITASSLRGRKFVLYAYPRDNTPGCTAEACSLRDAAADLKDAGYEIIGVSKDSQKSHQGFREKHSLPFPLISDTDTSLLQAIGAWGEKTNYGKTSMGTLRTTLLVDEEGRVTHIFTPRQIRTKDHADQILALLRQ